MPGAPDLNIPASTSTVNVSIVNTSGAIYGLPTSMFFEPKIPGHEHLATPIYSFLIQHPVLDRSIVFDLGIRKDHWKFPEGILENYEKFGVSIEVPKDVREILDEQGVDTKNIEAIIWSHPHLDHTGDPSTFEPSTTLIVGPKVKKDVLPGYPANKDTFILEADYAGREVRELDFSDSKIKIGKFPAIDYFGDGSFYLLDSPGHCVGHMCGLARVTSEPDSFILMGGDIIHHSGELRPHHWHPIPESITPHPFEPLSVSPCPGELFEKLLRDGKEQPFYIPAHPREGQSAAHLDPELAAESVRKLQEVDAHDNVLVAAAHEQYLLGVVDFFPKLANDFLAKGWVQKTRWAFLADFAKAAGYEDKIEAVGDYNSRIKSE